ncbi:MAG: peptide chain release factor N(5)-glutamine methyltransferase [Cyanophyceae cyanobacterium]
MGTGFALNGLGAPEGLHKNNLPLAIAAHQWRQWHQWARKYTADHQVPPSELDWFLLAVTDVDRLTLRLGDGDRPIKSQFDLGELTRRWKQRCGDRVPVQYLAGSTPWRTLNLQVTPAVLIPRPETELLVDLTYRQIQRHFPQPSITQPIRIADLGTGSGAIALGLAELLPEAEIYGVDCSEAAIAIAQKNGESLQSTVKFLCGLWFDPLDRVEKGATTWAAIISNPPYIPSETVRTLQPEVVNHEPHLALDGGEDGLDPIRYLIERSPEYLCPGGIWGVEHMTGQGAEIIELLQENRNYGHIQGHCDLSGRDRFVTAVCDKNVPSTKLR